ncbi:MAG: DUF4097 family beta strand repeat-containing protein [Oscillospiraceae bacterium]
MNRIINRWLIFTAAASVIFGVLLWYNRDAKGNLELFEGDNHVPLCDYIELNMLKTDVELLPYDGTDIRFQYKSTVPIEVLIGDNRLVVNESDEFRLSFVSQANSDFYFRLYMPRHLYRSIIVYSSSGVVSIDSIRSEAISAITKTGDIASVNTCSPVSLVAGSGDIFLDFAKVVAGCSLETRNGDAEVRFPPDSSVALSYETENGSFRSELLSGSIKGSYMYSFSGGENLIRADVAHGLLTVSERKSVN